MIKTNLVFLLSLGLMLGTAMCHYDPHPLRGSNTGAGGVEGWADGGIDSSKAGAAAGRGGGQAATNTSTPPGSGGSSRASVPSAGGGSATLPPVGGRTLATSVGDGGSSSSRIVFGGTIADGLSLPAAGAGGAGGGNSSSIGKPSGTTVTFNSGRALGAMTGYGWVAFGPADTVTDPMCGTEKLTAACATTIWSTKDFLCVTATIPALDEDDPDYANNWGVQLGVDSTDAKGGLGQAYTSVTITISGSPTSGLRAKAHLKGDAEGIDYCAEYTTAAIPFTRFTRACYDKTTPGKAITAAGVPNIDQISLWVMSSSKAISVKDLCITGITFR